MCKSFRNSLKTDQTTPQTPGRSQQHKANTTGGHGLEAQAKPTTQDVKALNTRGRGYKADKLGSVPLREMESHWNGGGYQGGFGW